MNTRSLSETLQEAVKRGSAHYKRKVEIVFYQPADYWEPEVDDGEPPPFGARMAFTDETGRKVMLDATGEGASPEKAVSEMLEDLMTIKLMEHVAAQVRAEKAASKCLS